MRISRHGRAAALAALAYTVLALAYTWPHPMRLGTGVTHDLGDPVLNTWILWWSGTHVPLTAQWWNAAAFYPATGILDHVLCFVAGVAWTAVCEARSASSALQAARRAARCPLARKP